jgi:acyl-CoA dehydrogenase
MIADMAIGTEICRLITLRAAYELDQGRKNTYYASIAKSVSGLIANRSAADAVQVNSTPINSLYSAVLLIMHTS